MYTVYILLSQKDNKRYTGYTHNIDHRICQHNSGKVTSTKNRRPLKLIYTETFENKSDAMKREREIKNKKGKFNIPD
ncbi:MAG: excinuclease ABC subunit C [Ignavibacteriae bacterium HGW-Ignavibacteriae-3]|nr:MAG: excinuclease ABC subunit C [Ignavibacteriae bacterium HGW-Ignavibacteriae-3]